MARFSQIDLAAYPVKDVIETLSFEDYLDRDKADLTVRWEAVRALRPDLPALETLDLESDPLNINLQVGAYRETLLRGYVNDRIKAVTLAGAKGRALDHIGATYYRTLRRVITPATDTTAAVLESDEVYRRRLAIAPEAWSTAGPEGAYIFWGLSASGDVLDIAAYSEDEGVCEAPEIRIPILSRVGDGSASSSLLKTVQNALRRSDIRPLADLVTVESAVPVAYNVSVHLRVKPGASISPIVEAATAGIQNYANGRVRWAGDAVEGPVWLIGRTIRQDTIAAAAFNEGVVEVEVNEPAANVNPVMVDQSHLFKAPRIGNLQITTEVMTGGWS